jgi:hypothetical protein
MILVDSAFLLALAEPTDSLHPRALAWARYLDEPLLVPEYVLWKVVNGLSRVPDRPRAHRVVTAVTSDPVYAYVPASPRLFAAGLQLHRERPDQEWSLTDCISFVLMRERRLTRALAYDHHFEQAGFEALLRREPPV